MNPGARDEPASRGGSDRPPAGAFREEWPEAARHGHAGDDQLRLWSIEQLEAVRGDWNRLALDGGNPFLTYEWISSWWPAFGEGELACVLLRSPEGAPRAAAACRLTRSRELSGLTNAYSSDWDVLAIDDRARSDAWAAIARFGARRLTLEGLAEGPSSAGAACRGLGEGGYRVLENRAHTSPYLRLPGTWDDLLASVSQKLRSQWRRHRRALERRGGYVLKTLRGEAELERNLDAFLALEASGWKGRSGTAILSDPPTERLYRSFAIAAARQGWLRLRLLESGGECVAASYGCAFAGTAFTLKIAFDERYADRSPGLVLLGEELRESIEEGLRRYDFLGAPEPHKLRWGSELRARRTVRAYRGPSALPAYVYRAQVRPWLGAVKRRTQGLREEAGSK